MSSIYRRFLDCRGAAPPSILDAWEGLSLRTALLGAGLKKTLDLGRRALHNGRAPVSAFPSNRVPRIRTPEESARRPVSEIDSNKEVDLDRDVVRCKVCGLVQYRTRTGNCRRCVRLLPPRVEFLVPPPPPHHLPPHHR